MSQQETTETWKRSLAKKPIAHIRARELYNGVLKHFAVEKITANGSIISHPTALMGVDGEMRHIESVSHVTDELIKEALRQDDRFKGTPIDLLQGLAKAAFQLGQEVSVQEQGPVNG